MAKKPKPEAGKVSAPFFWYICGFNSCFGPRGFIGLYSLDCYDGAEGRWTGREHRITCDRCQWKTASGEFAVIVEPGSGAYWRKGGSCSFLLIYACLC